jgi:hypothetical protein
MSDAVVCALLDAIVQQLGTAGRIMGTGKEGKYGKT